ncbi:MAG: D-alanyl-D-alanine carboxypeptidase/D-alanyl-D-alanine-endopeptidase [Bacteroidales bacterium]|nr:D-alanyl-D-alanine carboxypeptidase/D-alanyl-D-alanine-endopeptidase [Bacteroidales bacterium]
MVRFCLLIALSLVTGLAFSQERAIQKFISDSSMMHASVSLCIKDSENGEIVSEFNKGTSLIPASVMKLITSGAALELLGPQHTFRTIIGYTGTLNRRTGRLSGDIVIKGGGDPALGSEYFRDHYADFIDRWVSSIKTIGIKRIDGRIITDDSYYDYFPVSDKWQWEDLGNYYGAGVYGLSVFDNTVEIHLSTSSDNTTPVILRINPGGYNYNFLNSLITSGSTDEGYVLAAPYSTSGWLKGSVPAGEEDFILKGSMSDPPLFIAGLLNEKLKDSGIKIKERPTTVRLEGRNVSLNPEIISELESPPLSDIIEVLNHESVNLFAETLLKELGKRFRGNGSADSGLVVISDFLRNTGIQVDGMYIGDGSGLSPRTAINSEALTDFLSFMKNKGEYFPIYFNSLPEAGKEGTLKAYFRDVAFESRMRAKSGSMGRVRCYAGYIRANSGRNIVFTSLVNTFSGSSQHVISGIEEIIRDIILYK